MQWWKSGSVGRPPLRLHGALPFVSAPTAFMLAISNLNELRCGNWDRDSNETVIMGSKGSKRISFSERWGVLKYRDKKGFAHSGYFYQVDKIGHSLANITTALK